MSEGSRDDIIQDLTPYQATLTGLVFPWPLHVMFNLAGGLSLGLVGAPRLAVAWAVGMCAVDWISQRAYKRWQASAQDTDSRLGLSRLSLAVLARTGLWFAPPVAFTAMSHSPVGFALVGVMAIPTIALGISLGWTSWQVFAAMIGPAMLSVAVALVCGLGLEPAAGVWVAFASALVTLTFIAVGTNKLITEWSRANKRTIEVMAEIQAALERSETAERRLKVAIGIANLHVYEMDYSRRVLTSLGAEGDFFEEPLTYKQLWQDPFRGVAPEHRERAQEAWARYEAGEAPYRTEYRVKRADGRQVWAYASAEMTRDEAGNPQRLVGALQNVTESKRGEMELVEALSRAEAGSRAKSEFLTIMSHEIRTPLNGVLGMAQAMERDDLNADQRKRLEVIRKSGQSLLILLNSVLDLSKIEAGKLELEIGDVDITSLARAALDMFGGDEAGKDVAFSLEVTPEAEGIYAGDASRIGQVLHNLISNAVKFTPAGSVKVRISRLDGILNIEVADTGIGISPTQMSSLFEKFSQADVSVTRRFGGTGLGLAICRQLATKMDGEIVVESQEGEGSTFTVTLPLPRLRACRPGVEQRPAPVEDEVEMQDGALLRVLAAEDNAINQLVLRTLLHQVGVEVVIADDGLEALEAWRKQDWDLILMDIQMPGMDGLTAAREIRAEEAASGRARTPIVALTANVMSEQAAAYRDAGMDDVVPKPIEIARLLEAMQAALDASAAEPQPVTVAAA